ncbi:uncharacterized protein LOC122056938 [Macadamia integrifolia]|uniref:uncharacterized protein LOC122056938 n=1 Tax=Macadamia integrifolia TaxID=60698 RepID=UPI001C5298B0|nr:uncharacterized protein LOC122056938 [Macadamia integrifolia]
MKQGRGPKSQFSLIDIGSCWKNSGAPCDGDVLTDVTRYSEMSSTLKHQLGADPQVWSIVHHSISPQRTKRFTGMTLQTSHMQLITTIALLRMLFTWSSLSVSVILTAILRHKNWYKYFLTQYGQHMGIQPNPGKGSGTPPARRIWTSMDVGTEIYVSDKDETAECVLSDFNVLLASAAS